MIVDIDRVSHAGVLHEISLALPAAEMTVLAGRSGSGKTTLCHLIAGIMPPSGGRITVDGRPADSIKDWAQVSLLPQRLALDPELTVAENVLLPAGLRARPGETDLLDRLGLTPIAGRPARDTSVGEQQRTAIARALILAPAVAVLDEPTAHQDDEHVQLVLDVLVEAVQAGTLAVVATHDPRVIEIAGRTVQLRSGRVVTSAEDRTGPGS
jgi:ABC-type lipoprotein export system ATPase subunit